MSNKHTGYVINDLKKLRGQRSFDLPLYQGMAKLSSVVEDKAGFVTHGIPLQLFNVRKGYITQSFLNAIYNKLYINPSTINVGYVSSYRTIEISIFNGYFSSKILTDITYSDKQGVTVSNVTLPLLFSRLSMKVLSIDIESHGIDSINCTISFHFLNAEKVTLVVNGNRSLPLALLPNWSQGITETLEWKTNVHQSQTGAEQRVAMRLTPRRTFEFQALIYQHERRQIENILFQNYLSSFSLPVYSDIALLDREVKPGDKTIYLSTIGRDYYIGGNLIVIDGSNTIVANIESIKNSSITLSEPIYTAIFKGAKVFPIKSAKMTEPPRIIRRTDELATADLRFLVVEKNDINANVALPTYNNFYVLEQEPNWSDDVHVSYESMRREIDNQTGIIYYSDSAQRIFITQSHEFLINGRNEQLKLRALFYALRGRQKPIFVPSFSNDCKPVDDVTSEILDIEQNSMSETDRGGQFLRILLSGNRILYREIVNVKSNNKGGLRLLLNEKASFTRNEVIKISIMRLCRLNDDKVIWEHLTDADGTARIKVTFREVRYELE
ncbi:hypothetical protein [Gilliamella sp. Nev3-1]|uniref:hypothetical protein n=1 Tax=Gilliamella sp. Nev3-1 TaxID=3120250 RepID=UPI00080DB15E|nr:hypothetical protein [Gilliamella apicola]OCG60196.1 hypothetical protein A9G40_04665 [Gilliamella apicola]